MLRFVIIAFVSIICLSVTGSCVAGSIHKKPASPVNVWITPESKSRADDSVSFVVKATSAIYSQQFRIQVEPPTGMTLNSGALVWEGSLNSGETHELRFNASLPKNTPVAVTATASIQTPTGAQFAARAVYRSGVAVGVLNKPPSKSTFRGGRRVVEFPVR